MRKQVEDILYKLLATQGMHENVQAQVTKLCAMMVDHAITGVIFGLLAGIGLMLIFNQENTWEFKVKWDKKTSGSYFDYNERIISNDFKDKYY